MPQASTYINSVRAYAEGRNNKVQASNNVLNIDNLQALSCSAVSWTPLIYIQTCTNCGLKSRK